MVTLMKLWYPKMVLGFSTRGFTLPLVHFLEYKKALLCYNLFRSFLASRFLSDTLFICQISSFILWYLCIVFHCDGKIFVWVHVGFLHWVVEGSVCGLHNRGGGGRGRGKGGPSDPDGRDCSPRRSAPADVAVRRSLPPPRRRTFSTRGTGTWPCCAEILRRDF